MDHGDGATVITMYVDVFHPNVHLYSPMSCMVSWSGLVGAGGLAQALHCDGGTLSLHWW